MKKKTILIFVLSLISINIAKAYTSRTRAGFNKRLDFTDVNPLTTIKNRKNINPEGNYRICGYSLGYPICVQYQNGRLFIADI